MPEVPAGAGQAVRPDGNEQYQRLTGRFAHYLQDPYTPEILEHCQRIAKHVGLYDDALFHTEVQDLQWDAEQSRWIVRTDRGDAFTAQFLAMGTGPLHVPKLPGIPGIEDFRGHSFHTSRWDYDCTGGDPYGAPLERLGDMRVAVIGTGATAVQCLPHLARRRSCTARASSASPRRAWSPAGGSTRST